MSSENKNDGQWLHPDHSFWRQNMSSYDVNSKILLATIVSFSIIILIVFAYHLHARFIRRYRRSTFSDQTLFVVSQPPKRGLDITVLASLPTFVVGGGVNGGGDDVECSVCLTLLKEKDKARMLPSCKHVFHVTCIDTWLATCSTCPVCRTEVEPCPKIEPEPREGPVGDGASVFAVASSSDNKAGGSSVSRLDSFRRILTRERSLNTNDHSGVDQNYVDQDRVMDLERQ